MSRILSKNKTAFILPFIIVLAFFLRFYMLGSIPLGLNKDETAIGYNAYSILETGKDEYGSSFPLYFRSFDDYKLPVYIYMTSVSEKFFDVTPFAVRFPSALFGMLSVVAIYILVLSLSGKRKFALFASFLLAVNPWHIFFSRIGSEVNVATAFALFGTVLFVVACKRNISISYLLLSLLSFGVSLYCYNVTRIIAPLIVVALIFIYRRKLIKMSLILKAFFILVSIFILVPFLSTLFSSSGFQNQQGSVLLTGISFHAKALEFRSYLPHNFEFLSKILFNSYFYILWQYIQNIIGFFSVNFYFLNGPQNPINGVINMGMFNLAEFFFIPIGIYMSFIRKERYLSIFLWWMAIVVLVGSITNEVPHPTRSYIILIPFTVFSAYGLYSIIDFLRKASDRTRWGVGLVLFSIFIYSLISYNFSYFFRFPLEYAKSWRSEDRQVAEFIKQHEKNYDRIVFDVRADYAYTSWLFYSKFPPYDFIGNSNYAKDGLLNTLAVTGKYEFHKVDWEKEYPVNEKVLFITSPTGDAGGVGILKTFYYPVRPVINITDNNMIGYPYNEPAYVAIETVSSYEKNK